VAAENIEILNQARENFVRKRRAMAEQVFTSSFVVQNQGLA